MKKRFLPLFLALVMLCSIFPQISLPARAADYSGSCGDNLTWTLDAQTGVLQISGSGAMENYEWRNSPWYSCRESIQSVVFGNGVTRVGDCAFAYCTNLSGVSFPSSVASIGYAAFFDCDGLVSVSIPKTVVTLSESPFSSCANLKSITVDAQNPNYCSDSRGALYDKDQTKLLCVPGAIQGSYAIPNSVTEIGAYTFCKCTHLTGVTIPDSVTWIGFGAFQNCESLKSVVIPNSVQYIFISTFKNCQSLTSVTIPDSILRIDDMAFEYCVSLGSVTIPGSVESVGKCAFSDCESLTEVTMLNGVTIIKPNAFGDCPSLAIVSIPDSVTEIGSNAFQNCSSLTSVTIPKNVSTIGKYPFLECSSLTAITVDPRNSAYSSDSRGVLFNKAQTELIQAPGAIQGSYSIPGTVTTIKDSAFYSCANLSGVTIPDSVATIERSAFAYCSSLGTVSIPNSVTSLGAVAFGVCTSLGSVTISNQLTTIENYTFYYCTSLSDVTIPNSVVSIGAFAFEGCKKITEIMIPFGVVSIGRRAFSYCTSLTSLIIPSSVTSIENDALFYCKQLGQVEICNPSCEIFDEESGETLGQPGTTVVRGYAGSTAQTFANQHGYTFNAFDPTPCAAGHAFYMDTCRRCGYEAVSASEVFSDVKPGAYYDAAVLWAIKNGITSGTGNGKFSPNDTCTRAQVMTFLYKACGEPPLTSTDNPFSDVKPGKYYHDPVLWAFHHDPQITSGATNTTFGVKNGCKREQVVTFLWKAAGEPAPTITENPFTDADPEKYYYPAILWAYENGIVSGMSETVFGVGKTCTRAQIVTILHVFCQAS